MNGVEVEVILPKLLEYSVGARNLRVRASTLKGALEEICKTEPALKMHLFNEDGTFREHVLCFHNQTNTREMKSLDVKLKEGDKITILQAISGG